MEKITLNNYEAFLLDYFEGNLSLEKIAALKTFLHQHPELAIELNDEKLPSLASENLNFEHKFSLKKSDTFLIDEELIDYLENNLNAEQKVIVEQKLNSNSDLQELLLAYKKTILSIDDIADFNKNLLYKTEDEFILQNKSLHYMEGLLNEAEAKSFELESQKNDSLQKELSLLYKTKLATDQSVVYPHKSELKKEAKLTVLFNYRKLAAIAAAVLFLAGLFIITSVNVTSTTPPIEIAVNKLPDVTTQKALVSIDSTHNTVDVLKNTPIPVLSTSSIANNTVTKNHSEFTTTQTSTTKEHEAIANNEQQKTNRDSSITHLANTDVSTISKDVNTTIEIEKSQQQLVNSTNAIIPSESLTTSDILEVEEDEELIPSNKNKNKFWNKVVQLAKQANRIGIKKIELEERTKNSFVLSFNSISVEKK